MAKSIAEQLVGLRKAKDWSQEDVARAADVALNTYRRAEKGGTIRRTTFERITEALGHPMSFEKQPVKIVDGKPKGARDGRNA